MALENAKMFLNQIMKDKALRARVAGKAPDGVAVIAKELGFDVTAEELKQAEQDLRIPSTTGEKPVEMNLDDMDKVAGGAAFMGEDAPDGHEMGCLWAYHHYNYQKENNIWCQKAYYCNHYYEIEVDWDSE